MPRCRRRGCSFSGISAYFLVMMKHEKLNIVKGVSCVFQSNINKYPRVVRNAYFLKIGVNLRRCRNDSLFRFQIKQTNFIDIKGIFYSC